MAKQINKTEEKEPIHISKPVLDKFKDELRKVNWDFDKLCDAYLATKTKDGMRIVMWYDDTERYQKYLEKNGLADFDLFYDFNLPINYFKLLLSRTDLPISPPMSAETIARFREKLKAGGMVRTNV